MDNFEYLQFKNIDKSILTGDIDTVNLALIEHFGLDNLPEFLTVKNIEGFEDKIQREDCFTLFERQYWSQMSFKQKLIVICWTMNDFAKENGCDKKIIFKFINLKLKENAKAITDSESICFKLENLDNSSGIETFTTLVHEIIHFMDDKKYEILIEKYSNYVITRNMASVRFFDEIMSLPINGKIKNLVTQTEENITPVMTKEILLLKNLILTINSCAPKIIKSKKTDSEYQNFVNDYFYYLSPLEFRAFSASYKITQQYFPLAIDSQDLNALNMTQVRLNSLTKMSKNVKKFGIDCQEFSNMEMINNYNITVHASGIQICPEIMAKRKNLIMSSTDDPDITALK